MSSSANAHNPNFPANLAIVPSHRRDHGHSGDPGAVVEREVDLTFDAEAQKTAIEKYGIAGRVWYAAIFHCQPQPN